MECWLKVYVLVAIDRRETLLIGKKTTLNMENTNQYVERDNSETETCLILRCTAFVKGWVCFMTVISEGVSLSTCTLVHTLCIIYNLLRDYGITMKFLSIFFGYC